MANKSQVLAAARRAWGPKVRLQENRNALSKARRLEVIELRRAAKEEKEAHGPTKNTREALAALATAARFVVDVNGDHPSIPRMAVALAAVEALQAHNDRWRELDAEIIRLGKLGAHRERYAIVEAMNGPLPMALHLAHGDTLEDLLADIERKVARETERRGARA